MCEPSSSIAIDVGFLASGRFSVSTVRPGVARSSRIRASVIAVLQASRTSATVATAKVIDLSWVCSRSILGQKANTESVQTARIVIRKQGPII